VHIPISKDGKEHLLRREGYSGLFRYRALFFIGGIIKHGKSLNGLHQPVSTNSYKAPGTWF